MVIGIDSSILLGYYQAKAGVALSSGFGAGSSSTTAKVAPTPPWSSRATVQQASANVTSALAGHKIVDENARRCPQTMAALEKVPLSRIGEPSEVAALICWLASEEMTFSTGACFDISGGRATY